MAREGGRAAKVEGERRSGRVERRDETRLGTAGVGD